jgi:hypothetical protein
MRDWGGMLLLAPSNRVLKHGYQSLLVTGIAWYGTLCIVEYSP